MVARRALYLTLVGAVAVQRLAEMRTSRRNQAALVARGATVHAKNQLPAAVALHGGWLVASALEGWKRLDQLASPTRGLLGVCGLVSGHSLRLASMRALGDRWTASVVTLEGAPRVRTGVYRWLRHPNYLGVALEVAALPLAAGAWWTAATFSALDAVFLRARIRAEEDALEASALPPRVGASDS